MKPHLISSLLGALAFATAAVAADTPKKIVFLAGPSDHGGPPAHQYLTTLEGIKYAFDHSTNLKNVTTKLFALKPGQDYTAADLDEINELNTADVIVINSSADRMNGTVAETHAIFPLAATVETKTYTAEQSARLAQFDQLMKKGVGLVVLHYSDNIRHPIARKYFLDWVGGHHETDYSKTLLLGSWEMGLPNPQHPIARGVKPWKIGAEEFNLVQRLPDDPRRTAVFTAMSSLAAPNTPGTAPDPIGWAVQRAGGGRGFVYTGLHYHAYLSDPNNRTAILNGIAWAAGIEIPAEGVQGPMPEGFPTDVPARGGGRGRGPAAPGAGPVGTAPSTPATSAPAK
jgi:type 1 glutamine amidotransferase